MRHVYFDLGCNNGDTIEGFRNWSKIAFDEDWKWDIYAYDPNPDFISDWADKKIPNATFYQMAVWTDNDILDFAIDKKGKKLGSTLMKGKRKIWDYSSKIRVETVDFSSVLKKYKDDFVVVKMDIEGGEFPVLEKMIHDNTDLICDWLLVEFHPNKVVEYTTSYKNQLLAKLKSRNPNVREWH